jgi:hypothetical protein
MKVAVVLAILSLSVASAEDEFACDHNGYRALKIPKSKAHDGACDCCDCSDEEATDLPLLNQTCFPKYAHNWNNAKDFYATLANTKHRMVMMVHIPSISVFEHGRIEDRQRWEVPELPALGEALKEYGVDGDVEFVVSNDDSLLQPWSNRGLHVTEVSTQILRTSDMKMLAADHDGCLEPDRVMKLINTATQELDKTYSSASNSQEANEPTQVSFDSWNEHVSKANATVILLEVFWSRRILVEQRQGGNGQPAAKKEKHDKQSSLSNYLRQTFGKEERVSVLAFDARRNTLPPYLQVLLDEHMADMHTANKELYGDAGAARNPEWRANVRPGMMYPLLLMLKGDGFPSTSERKTSRYAKFPAGHDLGDTLEWVREQAAPMELETLNEKAYVLWSRMGHKIPHQAQANMTLMLEFLAINELINVSVCFLQSFCALFLTFSPTAPPPPPLSSIPLLPPSAHPSYTPGSSLNLVCQ